MADVVKAAADVSRCLPSLAAIGLVDVVADEGDAQALLDEARALRSASLKSSRSSLAGEEDTRVRLRVLDAARLCTATMAEIETSFELTAVTNNAINPRQSSVAWTFDPLSDLSSILEGMLNKVDDNNAALRRDLLQEAVLLR
jgi:hypothetical protein